MSMKEPATCQICSIVEEVRNQVELEAAVEKLRSSVTFLPLKDLRYKEKALQGHTWFMSSMNDTHEEGEVLLIRHIIYQEQQIYTTLQNEIV